MRAAVLMLGALLVVAAPPAIAAGPVSPAAPDSAGTRPELQRPVPELPADTSHRTGELDCRNCHQGNHQGVVRMYLGVGGRGTPMIPSHMFQVRVECAACHVVPKESGASAGLVGQTFRPSEQACVGCHGEKYRGMLERWSATLAKMQAVVDPKLAFARSALTGADANDPKVKRARALADDAEFNVKFVALGKGIHNVFYAADLLKLSNTWAGDAAALLGQTPPKGDDALVRGGYCAVLCHEQAGVKQRETVTFGKTRLPHVRHVAEFGAVCTACHSAEVHKAVTATAATCRSCHHAPRNERCESCHRAQSAFYRGEAPAALAKIEPNSMANAVSCTSCHDFGERSWRAAVRAKCTGCHDAGYADFLPQWTVDLDKAARAADRALARAGQRLAQLRRGGHAAADAETQLKEARESLALVRKARGVHNPTAAQAIVDAARRRAEKVLSGANAR